MTLAIDAGAAKLLNRAFDLDLEHRPNGGGKLKITAAILEQPVIEKIFVHWVSQARAPPRSAARGLALQAAWRLRSTTVQATRRAGPLESAASEWWRER